MTILRLDLQAGSWRAVSPRLFEDERLSLDTRAVAGFISTRSDTFSLSVSGLCSLLKIGEDKWRRVNAELTNAGYLKRIEGKDKRGRFRHELVFSPVPDLGDSESSFEKRPYATPKKPGQPGTAKPGSDQPRPAITRSTRNQIDQISDYHHPQGGGVATDGDPMPPIWIKAATYEVRIEELARPIRNRSALLNAIINRYRLNGGPDAIVLAALKKRESAEEEQKARDLAAREFSKIEEERAYIARQRHTQAEITAQAMTSQQRLLAFAYVESNAPIKATELARAAFIEHGQVLSGVLCHALVEHLTSLALKEIGDQ